MIDGVKIKQLKVIPDERGRLMEILRSDDEIYDKFGQAYMTTAYPGVVKAWHFHKFQVDHFAVVKGMMKVVFIHHHAFLNPADATIGYSHFHPIPISPQFLHNGAGHQIDENVSPRIRFPSNYAVVGDANYPRTFLPRFCCIGINAV